MKETLIVLALLIYGFGVMMGIYTERQKNKSKGSWSSSYQYHCTDCYPGVTIIIRARTQQHLEQVVAWHNEDHHDPEGDIRRAKATYILEKYEDARPSAEAQRWGSDPHHVSNKPE